MMSWTIIKGYICLLTLILIKDFDKKKLKFNIFSFFYKKTVMGLNYSDKNIKVYF